MVHTEHGEALESSMNAFRFFVDEDERTELKARFQLAREHLEGKGVEFGFQVLNEYLFLKRGTQLFLS